MIHRTRRRTTPWKKASATKLSKRKWRELSQITYQMLFQFPPPPKTLLGLIEHSRCCVKPTKDKFCTADIPCQLQQQHWPPTGSEDRDWASAAVDRQGEGQDSEGFPDVVESGGFESTGDWPLFYPCDNASYSAFCNSYPWTFHVLS